MLTSSDKHDPNPHKSYEQFAWFVPSSGFTVKVRNNKMNEHKAQQVNPINDNRIISTTVFKTFIHSKND